MSLRSVETWSKSVAEATKAFCAYFCNCFAFLPLWLCFFCVSDFYSSCRDPPFKIRKRVPDSAWVVDADWDRLIHFVSDWRIFRIFSLRQGITPPPPPPSPGINFGEKTCSKPCNRALRSLSSYQQLVLMWDWKHWTWRALSFRAGFVQTAWASSVWVLQTACAGPAHTLWGLQTVFGSSIHNRDVDGLFKSCQLKTQVFSKLSGQ
jgi:hypothetical protein